MRTLVMGDIHGACRALLQCFERSGFDREKDRLVTLGDVCDGWPETRQAVDELLGVKNLVALPGNHDRWFLDYILKGEAPLEWLTQGGLETLSSYGETEAGGKAEIPETHAGFFCRSVATPFYLRDNRLFVHGGFVPERELSEQDEAVFLRDRKLLLRMRERELENRRLVLAGREKKPNLTTCRDIFVGHTPTLNFRSDRPLRFCELRMLDTGAAWKGRLTVMDVETKKYWQSDPVPGLYPEHGGRADWI